MWQRNDVPSFKSTFAYSRRLNRGQENYFLSEYIVHSVQTLADRLIEHCFTFVSANKDIPASFSSFLSRPSTQDRYEDSSLSFSLFSHVSLVYILPTRVRATLRHHFDLPIETPPLSLLRHFQTLVLL